jgi:hypothetical protein
MIFKKDVSFPYPILAPFNEDYPECEFDLDINFELIEEDTVFRFQVTPNLNSHFLNNLLQEKKAKYKLIISSHDSKIFDYDEDQGSVDIPRNRISLKRKTQIQMALVAMEEINFKDNLDLDSYYNALKSNVNIQKDHLLALSEVVNFNGELTKPFVLFKYEINPDLESEIEFSMVGEFINIHLREKEFKYLNAPQNYHYVYMGLQKALAQLIFDNAEGESSLRIDSFTGSSPLQEKLRIYLEAKNIDEISLESLERAIDKMTDKIMSKHNKSILGVSA